MPPEPLPSASDEASGSAFSPRTTMRLGPRAPWSTTCTPGTQAARSARPVMPCCCSVSPDSAAMFTGTSWMLTERRVAVTCISSIPSPAIAGAPIATTPLPNTPAMVTARTARAIGRRTASSGAVPGFMHAPTPGRREAERATGFRSMCMQAGIRACLVARSSARQAHDSITGARFSMPDGANETCTNVATITSDTRSA